MNLTPEEIAIGKDNFTAALGHELTRRPDLWNKLPESGLSSYDLGPHYFGYDKIDDPVRIGVIGTGDEGQVLISNMNPKFVQVVAIADIRPYNQWRAFVGDVSNANTLKARRGLIKRFEYASEEEAKKNIKVYKEDYKELLKNPDVEAVIIAVPLHLHAEIAIEAAKAGKHVLSEKLMAHNITQCKRMGLASQENDVLLCVGHQRHYSVLYDNTVHLIKQGLIGDIHHIRAQWHRGNKPGNDSWQPPLPKDCLEKLAAKKEDLDRAIKNQDSSKRINDLEKQVTYWTKRAADEALDAIKYGYKDFELGDRTVPAIEELIRWRLWNRTGGGLMAELGSHQLDAAGIFCSALRTDGKKAKPLAVTATGGRHIFPLDRECDDHVYCMFEFPGPGYDEDPNKKICVTYSSINGNGYGGYGEWVMGTKGTLVLEKEKDIMLFKSPSTSESASPAVRLVNKYNEKGELIRDKDNRPVVGPVVGPHGNELLELRPETKKQDTATSQKLFGEGDPSRGYAEEIEHFAYCIRNRSPENIPKCHAEVAMADAILALTANIAMKKNVRIEFKEEWFRLDSKATPEEDLKDIK